MAPSVKQNTSAHLPPAFLAQLGPLLSDLLQDPSLDLGNGFGRVGLTDYGSHLLVITRQMVARIIDRPPIACGLIWGVAFVPCPVSPVPTVTPMSPAFARFPGLRRALHEFGEGNAANMRLRQSSVAPIVVHLKDRSCDAQHRPNEVVFLHSISDTD
jgi:hypothetical protein